MSSLGRIIYSVYSTKREVEKHQMHIRNVEWEAVKPHIIENSKFLDIGCGAGYSMYRATQDLNCECIGIDPDPTAHGVGRYAEKAYLTDQILQGFSENLPFDDESFDVVYSSHVLEHVNDQQETLLEMKRVLKQNGVLIIGMPTASMAWVNLITTLVFTTHIKLYEFFKNIFKKGSTERFLAIFVVRSHSYPLHDTVFSDLLNYRITRWRKIVKTTFSIDTELTPAFYPFPDYPQVFSLHKNQLFSSSVFFVCRKKPILS